jgi:hypothetical protein
LMDGDSDRAKWDHDQVDCCDRTEQKNALSNVEAQFVNNWASLAQIFGMDARLGRVHAVVYLSSEPISCAEVASPLGAGTYLARKCPWLQQVRNDYKRVLAFGSE